MQAFKRLSNSAFSWFVASSSSFPPLDLVPPSQSFPSPSPPIKVEDDTDDQHFPYPTPKSDRGSHCTETIYSEENVFNHVDIDETMSDLSDIEEYIEESIKFASSPERSYDANAHFAEFDMNEKKEQNATFKAAEEDSFDFVAERNKLIQEQKHQAWRMLNEDGWNVDTVELYMLLGRRDYEVLFPDSWRTQYPLFPREIFCTRWNPNSGLLRPLSAKRDSTMRWALTRMLDLGPLVRNSSRKNGHTFYKRRPEGLVEDYIKHYIKMVYKDAGLERDVRKKYLVPMICFASAMYGTPTTVLEARILERLRRRADRLLDLLHVNDDTAPKSVAAAKKAGTLYHDTRNGEMYLYEPPAIYGIVSKETVCGLVAYEPLRDKLRPIAFFHFSKQVFDVWNVIALALMVVWCRNHMLMMKEVLPDRSQEQATDAENDEY